MEKYIVKIKSTDDGCTEYGTGIAIGTDMVIVPSHVVSGEKHYISCNDKAIEATIIKENEYGFSLIKTQESLSEFANIFTNDEILDCETEWTIHGFITDMQAVHEMSGKGIHTNELINEQQNWNSILLNVSSGRKNRYKGLSGSPVFTNNRIIGIIQRQEIVDSGNTELKMATVDMFIDLLPSDVVADNEYKIQLLKMVTEHTANEIQKNIKNRKYIPTIYVEEGEYKEMVRYFADPFLFIQKSLNDLLRLDFTDYNTYLLKNHLPTIDFSKYKCVIESKDYTDAVNELTRELDSAYNNIDQLRRCIDISDDYEKDWLVYNNSLKHRIYGHIELLEMATKKYLLLTKEAGQGKTNFLCDFTNNFLLKKSYYVLYFNASSFSSNPIDSFLKFITQDNKYDIKYANKTLNEEYKKTKRPFIVVIDGLNENNHISDFANQIKLFLEKCVVVKPFCNTLT